MKTILAILFTMICFTAQAVPSIPEPITEALKPIEESCAGFRIVSHYRPGARVAGTRRTSLHASGRAVDFAVKDYKCAYHLLGDWPGGISMDAWRVHHIHLSVGGHEGHFNHRSVRRYARHHHHRHRRA